MESLFYPVNLLSRLEPLADIVTEDQVTILKLRREKILLVLAKDHKLDIVDLLTQVANRPPPPNVVTEIQEWSGQSDTFTLFEGFGILEAKGSLPEADQYTVEQVAPNLRVVRDPQPLFTVLEKMEQIPFLLQHSEKSLRAPTKGVPSIFAKRTKSV